MPNSFAHPEKRSELPVITVVVPALNEAQYITETLIQLAAQDYPEERLEILVVDGGSTDNTSQLVETFAGSTRVQIQLLHNPNSLSSSARNIGIRQSRGEYVLFVDAHISLPTRRIFLDMAMAARAHGARVLARPQPLNAPGLTPFQSAISAVRASAFGHSRESFIYSGFEGWVSPLSVAVMYHRSVLEEHGLFDESFDAAEDLEYNYRLERAGIRAFFSPKFAVEYYPRKNIAGLILQMKRYGMGRVAFTRKHPERFHPEIFVPCLALLALLLTPLLLMLEYLRPAVMVAAGALSLLITLTVARHLSRPSILPLLLAPVCLCAIHIGLAYGVIRGFWGGVVATAETESHRPDREVEKRI